MGDLSDRFATASAANSLNWIRIIFHFIYIFLPLKRDIFNKKPN